MNLAGDELKGHLLPGLEPLGVPKGLAGTMYPFNFNDLEGLRAVFDAHGDKLAAIVMEPVRGVEPTPEFLAGVRELATRSGTVLLLDEITSGFRMNTGGMHQVYGFEPDMVTYAKTMSNGFAMAAAIGKRSVMDAAQKTFISSAYWTEKVGPAAAIATVKKHRRLDVGKTLAEIGRRVQQGWTDAANRTGLPIKVSGIPPLASFSIDHPEAPALVTLFIQDLLDRGYLAADRFYANLKHEEAHIAGYLEAVETSFGHLVEALEKGDVTARLRGPVKHTGFKRLTGS